MFEINCISSINNDLQRLVMIYLVVRYPVVLTFKVSFHSFVHSLTSFVVKERRTREYGFALQAPTIITASGSFTQDACVAVPYVTVSHSSTAFMVWSAHHSQLIQRVSIVRCRRNAMRHIRCEWTFITSHTVHQRWGRLFSPASVDMFVNNFLAPIQVRLSPNLVSHTIGHRGLGG